MQSEEATIRPPATVFPFEGEMGLDRAGLTLIENYSTNPHFRPREECGLERFLAVRISPGATVQRKSLPHKRSGTVRIS